MSSPTTPPATTVDPNVKLRWTEKVGYGVGDTASCLFWVMVASYLNKYYTDVFGLPAHSLALLFLITRLWDAAFDLVMGMVADRTKSRWGKYRFWILVGIVPFMLAEISLFYVPDLGQTGKLVYAYITYSLTMFLYSVLNVPYGALLGVITSRSEERDKLASYRFVGAFVGNLTVQYGLLHLVQHFGQGDQQKGFLITASIFAVASAILFFFLFASTTERVQVAEPEKVSIGSDLKDLSRNRPWVTLFFIGVVTLIYVQFRQGTSLYYLEYYMGRPDLSTSFMTWGTVFSILGVISAPFFVKLFGCKRRAFIVMTVWAAVVSFYNYFAGPQDVNTVMACHFIVSIPLAAIFPMMGSMFADTADYGEWKYGRRATGLIFAGQTFSQKTGGGIGAALALQIMAWTNYVPNVQQSTEALGGIRHLMTTLPAAVGLLVAGVALTYPLGTKRAKEISDELQVRRTKSPAAS